MTLRVVIFLAGFAYFAGGVAAVASVSRQMQVHTLGTRLDAAIPFIPWTVYLYSWSYTFAVYPLFVVRCWRLFRRVTAAYLATVTAAFACFLAFPVTSIGLRGDVGRLDDRSFTDWAMRVTYAIDPPFNLFPSMHLSLAIVTAMSAFTASRRLGLAAAPVALAIAVTICTTKQHFVADGAAALVLGAVVYRFVLAPYEAERVPEPERSFGWKGAALYLAFHLAFYLSGYTLFRLGWRPW
jgi:hypothetical protein